MKDSYIQKAETTSTLWNYSEQVFYKATELYRKGDSPIDVIDANQLLQIALNKLKNSDTVAAMVESAIELAARAILSLESAYDLLDQE